MPNVLTETTTETPVTNPPIETSTSTSSDVIPTTTTTTTTSKPETTTEAPKETTSTENIVPTNTEVSTTSTEIPTEVETTNTQSTVKTTSSSTTSTIRTTAEATTTTTTTTTTTLQPSSSPTISPHVANITTDLTLSSFGGMCFCESDDREFPVACITDACVHYACVNAKKITQGPFFSKGKWSYQSVNCEPSMKKQSSSNDGKNEKKSNGGLIGGLIMAFIIIGAGCWYYFVYRKANPVSAPEFDFLPNESTSMEILQGIEGYELEDNDYYRPESSPIIPSRIAAVVNSIFRHGGNNLATPLIIHNDHLSHSSSSRNHNIQIENEILAKAISGDAVPLNETNYDQKDQDEENDGIEPVQKSKSSFLENKSRAIMMETQLDDLDLKKREPSTRKGSNSSDYGSLISGLENLRKSHEEGILSDLEFQLAKEKLLLEN